MSGLLRLAVRCLGLGAVVVGPAPAIAGSAAALCEPRWIEWLPQETGCDSVVYSATTWDSDGPGPKRSMIVIGGEFTSVNGVPASYIAAWNGARWTSFGPGFNLPVHAVCVYNGDLIAAGEFTRSGATSLKYVARWDGQAWQPLGPGRENSVYTLGVYQGELIAGGIGGSPSASPRLARWNGVSWSALGSGISNGANDGVYALGEFNGELYVGGSFTAAGGLPANMIAKWNGSNWSTVGGGMAGGLLPGVFEVCVYHGQLYAGGRFNAAGSVSGTANLARWDGTTWSPVGSGVSNAVVGLHVYGNELYVCGDFSVAGGITVNKIARWNDSLWQACGTGVSSDGLLRVQAITQSNGELFVGGFFTSAGGNPANYIARWSASGTPWIAEHPEAQSVSSGGSATFQVSPASGYDFDGPLGFEWRRDGAIVSDGIGGASNGGGFVAGAQTHWLTIDGAQVSDAGTYECRVFNSCGSSVSGAAILSVAPPVECPADANGDGAVNGADLSVLLATFGTSQPAGTNGDLNGDGVVNGADLSVLLAGFGTSCQ